MLKLKKIAKSMEVVISLGSKESFFSRPLLQAFAIAISLHLFFLFFVQIRTFNIFGNPPLINPVVVNADIAYIDQNEVLAQLDLQEDMPRAIREPKGSELKLPEVPRVNQSFVDIDYLVPPKSLNPLAFVEQPSHPTGTEIRVSGPISDRFIDEPITPVHSKGPSIRYLYQVQVDNASGALIWFEAISGYSDRTLTAKAETILKNMKFTPEYQTFAANGSVEIVFWREEG